MEFMHWTPSPKGFAMYWEVSNEQAMIDHEELEPELQSLERINKFFDLLPSLLFSSQESSPELEETSANQPPSMSLPNLPPPPICRILWPPINKASEADAIYLQAENKLFEAFSSMVVEKSQNTDQAMGDADWESDGVEGHGIGEMEGVEGVGHDGEDGEDVEDLK